MVEAADKNPAINEPPEGDYLSEGSRIWTEEYRSPNGMAGVVAHWGVRYSREDMNNQVNMIADTYGFNSPITKAKKDNTGFDTLYRMPDGQTEEEIDTDVERVALILARKAMELRGWEPGEVGYLDFGSSVGKGDMASDLAAKLGLVNAQTANAYLACNSSGFLLDERLRDESSKGKKVLLLSVDAITRLLRNTDEADIDSIQMFSNAGGVLAYISGVDLIHLGSSAAEFRDEVGITAIAPYGSSDSKGKETVLFRRGSTAMVDMTAPPDGMTFKMDARETASVFVEAARESARGAVADYRRGRKEDDQWINIIIGHMPSKLVFTKLKGELRKLHLNLPESEWGIVTDGNSSGATSLIAFNRSMGEYQPRQRGLYLSYGAGGTSNSFVFEVGEGSPQV